MSGYALAFERLPKIWSEVGRMGRLLEETNAVPQAEQKAIDLLVTTMLAFMGSDCYLADEEADLLDEALGFAYPRHKLRAIVEDQVSIDNFIYSVPDFIEEVVEAELRLGLEGSASVIVTYVVMLATLVCLVDDVEDDEEIEALGVFERTLKSFLRQNGVPVEPGDGNAEETCEEAGPEHGTNLFSGGREVSDVLEELQGLIGLQSVKQEVMSLVNLMKVRKLREAQGIASPALSMHLVFSGNPGTGKTTVARLLAEVYKGLGVLSKGHLIETDRSGLVGGYVGQTALKVQEVVTSAIGGVLFIDEAYSLVGSGENDYGQEAIDTLLKLMEDNRGDLVVIVAGYPEKMDSFLSSNPGLRSRFNKFIRFDDYTPAELLEIFDKFCRDSSFTLSSDARILITSRFEEMYRTRKTHFGNGRAVRNFFERVQTSHSNRIVSITNPSVEDLTLIVRQDVADAELAG